MMVTCKNCGWVHFPLTREEAIEEVEKFNKYFDSLTEQKQKYYYNGRKSDISHYEKCFNCGGDYTNFRLSIDGDCPDGVTIQPIIWVN
jgi:uncharacterized OB-fold protein